MQGNKTSSSLSASSTHQAPSCEADMERELSGLPPDIQALLRAAPFGRDARGAPLTTQPKRPRRGTRAHQSSSSSSASAITAASTTTTTSAASGSSSSSSTPDPDNNTPAAAASSASSSSSCATSTTTSTTSASLGSPSPSAPHRSSSSSSSPRQQLSTKTRSFSSSSSSSSSSSTVITSSTPSAVTKSQRKPTVKQPNPPKPKKGKVAAEAEPRKPLVAVVDGLTPTISTITPAVALAEGARVAETVTETNVPSVTSSSSTQSEDPIVTQESLTNNAEHKSGIPSDTKTAASADNNGAETRMTSASTGVTTLVGHVTTTATTKVPSGNFQVTSSVETHIEGIYLREQMLNLLVGTLPRCGSASALRFLTPSLLYSVFIWARASEKRLVIVLRTSTGQGTPEDRALKLGLWQDAGVISSELEVNPVWRSPEEPWLVTFAGEDHYVVHQKNGPGTPSIFKLRNVQRPGDSRVLLVIPTPPPRVFHCKTNSHWVLYHYGTGPEFYVEPALLPPTTPQIGSASFLSSLLKIQQEELGLSEGHVISLVALSKREPHLALLVSRKANADGTQAEYHIIFWNIKKSVERKRFHEIERWSVTGMQVREGETISKAFVIRSGSSDDDCNLGDDAVVVAKSSMGRVHVIKRKNPSAPHLVQSAGSEVRNLFPIGNGTKFCVTYDGRYELRDANTPEDVLMTVDTTGFMSVQWETNTGLMLAMSEKKKKKVVGDHTVSADKNKNKDSDTIQHIDVRNVEDNRSLFRVTLIQRWYADTGFFQCFSFSSPHDNNHHTP